MKFFFRKRYRNSGDKLDQFFLQNDIIFLGGI